MDWVQVLTLPILVTDQETRLCVILEDVDEQHTLFCWRTFAKLTATCSPPQLRFHKLHHDLT